MRLRLFFFFALLRLGGALTFNFASEFLYHAHEVLVGFVKGSSLTGRNLPVVIVSQHSGLVQFEGSVSGLQLLVVVELLIFFFY